MAKDDYASIGGSLKLKGGGGGVTKSKNKKKQKKPLATNSADGAAQSLESAATASVKDAANNGNNVEPLDDQTSDLHEFEQGTGSPAIDVSSRQAVPQKTEAERKFEERRRERRDQKLLKDGAKTHKERVDEFNKYLSNLSEHHDMPRIGPG